jgi:hypothetical protein
MLLWIGAGVLSLASIPAIGATVSHRHHARARTTHKTAPVSHASRAKSHAKLTHRAATHKKLAAKRTHATSVAHRTYGITSMHSGRTNPTRPAAKVVAMKGTSKARTHLLAATK